MTTAWGTTVAVVCVFAACSIPDKNAGDTDAPVNVDAADTDGPATDAPSVDAPTDAPTDARVDAACPWVTGWTYRQSFTITNTAAASTNLQLRLTLNTAILVSNTKMQANGSDIRIAAGDGVTLLPYVIESGMNTGQTTIWTKVANVPAGTSTVYLYYGNAAAPAQSNAASVWVQGVLDNASFETSATWQTLSNPNGCSGGWTFPDAGSPFEGSSSARGVAVRGGANVNGCNFNVYQPVVLPSGSHTVRYDYHQSTNGGPASSVLYVCSDAACSTAIAAHGAGAVGDNLGMETTAVSGNVSITLMITVAGSSGGGGSSTVFVDNLRLRKVVSPAPTTTANIDETTMICP